MKPAVRESVDSRASNTPCDRYQTGKGYKRETRKGSRPALDGSVDSRAGKWGGVDASHNKRPGAGICYVTHLPTLLLLLV